MPTDPFRQLGDQAEDATEPLPVGRSLITVIGIDKYTHRELSNAVNDARTVLKLFKRCGFEEPANAPALFDDQATYRALTSLVRDQLKELEPDDSLVIFFAGHGDTVESKVPDPQNPGKVISRRTGYLIPVDARPDKSGDWLKLDDFLDDISKLPVRHVLVILDACKSGFALSEKFKFRDGGQQEGTIADLSRRVSRRVITSAMHDEKAMDGGGSDNSLFTETLVDAIENLRADSDGDGFITTTDLFAFVRQQVGDTAAQVHRVKQTPDFGYLPGDGSGELVLSLRGDAYNRLRAAETLKVADQIYQLGWLSGDTKRFESAMRYYKTAQDLATLGKIPLPDARLGLGKALLAVGKADEAAQMLEQMVQAEGDSVPGDTQRYLGFARAKLGDYAGAAVALRAWLAMEPESLDAAWIGGYADWLSQAEHPSAGRKLALLVGIDQYALARAQRLAGCENDVTKLMKPALVKYGGFGADDIKVLTNAQATRKEFLAQMHRLKTSATLSDAVLVHFSGHSVPASAPDTFGRNDVENIYLLLHDTNDASGYLSNGITADQLHLLMQDIPAGRKTLILDTHPSLKLRELARSEGSYALVMASDSAEVAYEWSIGEPGNEVRCGLLTGALFRSLTDAGDGMLTYGRWITDAIQIAEKVTSNRNLFPQRQTPYFSGIRNQRVFGPDDIYLSVYEFSKRQEWPELYLDELRRLYSTFCQAITVSHPRGHAAYGRAFMSKGANDLAAAAFGRAVDQAGGKATLYHVSLARALFRNSRYRDALDIMQRDREFALHEDIIVATALKELLQRLTTSRKHALLVGIDRYADPGIEPLAGAGNDVASMKQLLADCCGFQLKEMIGLVDAEATREAILDEFRHLVESAAQEPALFFFAGRGSHDNDRLPTIVPYDGRLAGVADISLEELAKLAGQGAANLTVLLDTDFSGQSYDNSVRSLEPDPRAKHLDSRFSSEDERGKYLAILRIGTFMTFVQRR